MSQTFDSTDAQTSNEIEVFPGIHERRQFIRGSLSVAAALLALKASTTRDVLAQASKPTTEQAADKLAWDEFLKQAIPMAQQLIGSSEFSFDEYLYRIGSLATRLKEIPDSKLGPYTDVDRRVWFGPSFRGTPFFIIQWRMDPGAFLPPHNHPNASVCTLSFAGEVLLRNFQIIGEAPDYTSGKAFRVRETRRETMEAGRISTLSPARDNIHCFQVGKVGARGIDINTIHSKPGPFSFLDMNEKPIDSDNRIYEVTWNPQMGQPKKA